MEIFFGGVAMLMFTIVVLFVLVGFGIIIYSIVTAD